MEFSWTDMRSYYFVVPLVIDNLPVVVLTLMRGTFW